MTHNPIYYSFHFFFHFLQNLKLTYYYHLYVTLIFYFIFLTKALDIEVLLGHRAHVIVWRSCGVPTLRAPFPLPKVRNYIEGEQYSVVRTRRSIVLCPPTLWAMAQLKKA